MEVFYITEDRPRRYAVKTWNGKTFGTVTGYRKSKTNWGVDRLDVWFTSRDEEGNPVNWWGRNQGDNLILRCRKVK